MATLLNLTSAPVHPNLLNKWHGRNMPVIFLQCLLSYIPTLCYTVPIPSVFLYRKYSKNVPSGSTPVLTQSVTLFHLKASVVCKTYLYCTTIHHGQVTKDSQVGKGLLGSNNRLATIKDVVCVHSQAI